VVGDSPAEHLDTDTNKDSLADIEISDGEVLHASISTSIQLIRNLAKSQQDRLWQLVPEEKKIRHDNESEAMYNDRAALNMWSALVRGKRLRPRGSLF
jgi:hypothetical protein